MATGDFGAGCAVGVDGFDFPSPIIRLRESSRSFLSTTTSGNSSKLFCPIPQNNRNALHTPRLIAISGSHACIVLIRTLLVDAWPHSLVGAVMYAHASF